MATNLAIDMHLLEEAKKIGNMRTKKETVNSALKEFIERRKQKMILNIEGKIEFRKDWNYKKDRDRQWI